MNKKNYSFDLETFRDMLQICSNHPGQKFVDPPFEEEILAFIRELGYSGNVKSLSDVKKNVDYVYLLWEDLVYQIENKVSKKNKDMYYPRFTKVIINHFMSKDQSIPRRNKVDWHMASNDHILTTMRFIPKHETIQKYGAILPDTLTNQAIKDSEAYKTYHDFATRKVVPKPKENTDQDPKASPGKRLKATAKVATSRKKKLPAQGLETLSEIAFGSGADEGTGVSPRVPDVPTYGSEDEQISWKSSDDDGDDDNVSESKDDDDNVDNEDDDGQDDDNEQTESDNNGEDFIHPKFSTHDEEERQEEEDKEEEGSDLRVHTPSHFESTNDETYNYVTQGDNVEGEELDQTGGPREEELEKNLNQLVHQRRRLPSHLTILKNCPNLIIRLLANQPVDETTQHPDCTLSRNKDPRESFNELMDTPLDFSAFVLNRLKVDTLTLELLTGPTYELMKGSCKSLVELEYFLEEVCKATTDQLEWNNPEGQQYPHDLHKPLPLIPNSRGRRVMHFDHFINNDLAYLSRGVSSRTYATSVTKTKAADYGHIK
ncbi:hypothetical protein Tco_1371000 [Tanacetum coccineum]